MAVEAGCNFKTEEKEYLFPFFSLVLELSFPKSIRKASQTDHIGKTYFPTLSHFPLSQYSQWNSLSLAEGEWMCHWMWTSSERKWLLGWEQKGSQEDGVKS